MGNRYFKKLIKYEGIQNARSARMGAQQCGENMCIGEKVEVIKSDTPTGFCHLPLSPSLLVTSRSITNAVI